MWLGLIEISNEPETFKCQNLLHTRIENVLKFGEVGMSFPLLGNMNYERWNAIWVCGNFPLSQEKEKKNQNITSF